MFVYLVGTHDKVVALGQAFEFEQINPAQDSAGRVVRRVDHDHARARGDGIRHALPVDAVLGRCQRQPDRSCASQNDGRFVAVIGGIEHDHFVASPTDGSDRAVDCFGRARRDRNFGFRRNARAIATLHLGRDRFT